MVYAAPVIYSGPPKVDEANVYASSCLESSGRWIWALEAWAG